MTQYVIQSTAFKTYVCGDPNTSVNQKKIIGGWEKWQIEHEGDHYFIKSAHGTYLRNDINGTVNLTPNRGEWEKWYLGKGHDGYFSIKSAHGKYLRCHDKNGLINSSDNFGAWESFVIVKVVDRERWMESLDDNQCLSDLSIPGTHDSASYGIKNLISKIISETQKFSIEESLLNGARFLDIRLRLIDNHLVCHHGQTYLHQNFDDVLNKCDYFLKGHPKETILMRIKKEWHDENSNITFEASFDNYVKDRPSLFFQENSIPHLGAARGKVIVLSQHYPHVQGHYWNTNEIQDEWEVRSLEQKTNGINSHISKRMLETHNHKYSICFFSGYYAKECLNPTKILNPKRFAEDMNPWALSNLPLPKVGSHGFGILVFDFLNEEICVRMISTNPFFYFQI